MVFLDFLHIDLVQDGLPAAVVVVAQALAGRGALRSPGDLLLAEGSDLAHTALCSSRLGVGASIRDLGRAPADLGALAPKPVFSFNWSSYPTGTSTRTTGVRGDWRSLEIKRFTITARTSMRSFKAMLVE